MKVRVYDNLVSHEDNEYYRKLLLKAPFYYGTIDDPGSKPSGLINEFEHENIQIYPILEKIKDFYLNKIFEVEPTFKESKPTVTRLNLFLPRETPRFHDDSKEWITFIFYINPDFEPNEGGETQFIINKQLKSVPSLPGRLVMFDGGIIHRATSFLNEARLTLVFSFEKLK